MRKQVRKEAQATPERKTQGQIIALSVIFARVASHSFVYSQTVESFVVRFSNVKTFLRIYRSLYYLGERKLSNSYVFLRFSIDQLKMQDPI